MHFFNSRGRSLWRKSHFIILKRENSFTKGEESNNHLSWIPPLSNPYSLESQQHPGTRIDPLSGGSVQVKVRETRSHGSQNSLAQPLFSLTVVLFRPWLSSSPINSPSLFAISTFTSRPIQLITWFQAWSNQQPELLPLSPSILILPTLLPDA